MSKQNDGLFLLEVLIDKIVFVKSPCFSDKDFRTCVNIECPAVEPLEICDDDPGACVATSGGPFVKQFNNGKSCLFSLKESDISAAMSKFPVKVSVYKSLPCGCLPTKIIMGECTIDMTKEFVEARNKFLADPSTVSYQALKDSFRITGSDSTETGEIVMFLRISCFGKLIVTRFQGSNAPPNLGAGGSTGVVDRSCNPRKDTQSVQDLCACGVARGHGSGAGGGISSGASCKGGQGICPIAGDPYNKMPCEDPDDPCYCSGPKPEPKQPMACRNTDQYCLHIPKGSLLGLPIIREMADEQKNINFTSDEKCQLVGGSQKASTSCILFCSLYQASTDLDISTIYQCLDSYARDSCTNFCNPIPATSFELAQNKIDLLSEISLNQGSELSYVIENVTDTSLFGLNETVVYMTFEEYHRRTSGTQATASINKCLQVQSGTSREPLVFLPSNANHYLSCAAQMPPYHNNTRTRLDTIPCSEVYFFGRSKKDCRKKGMEPKESRNSLQRSGQISSSATRSAVDKSTRGSNTNSARTKGATTGTSTSKSVSIKDDKVQKPCPAVGTPKGEMMATISHIKIAPKETCPTFGKEPCIGPRCIVATSGEEQGPIKVTTVNNPRRGVFELVIRKMTGAPLAVNELMLEWTPPPSRPPPCSNPCPTPFWLPSPCRPPKCKMIVCRPTPCRPKCCKKKPCGQPCVKCSKPSCCDSPCKPCKPRKPCPPSRCCPPGPCKSPCSLITCKTPCFSCCKSSPCLRPCPIGRRKPRRARSQPKIRCHRKHASPCSNRSKTCPVVRCRSVPGPCLGCCGLPPFCSPKKCCSVSPCKPPIRCKSSCSSCCS